MEVRETVDAPQDPRLRVRLSCAADLLWSKIPGISTQAVGIGILMVRLVKIGPVFPVERVGDVIFEVGVIVAEVIVVWAGETSEVEGAVVGHPKKTKGQELQDVCSGE